ncbi:hypothetical protein WDZ17_02605 [Pseudokineococcus basanitobsidens]|uniref:Uncharacterized protein n=1 Tax=Pseudokineococcus basanitobsidens TaxID=1926649 RepID=A0ABU8RGN3_9ACTN
MTKSRLSASRGTRRPGGRPRRAGALTVLGSVLVPVLGLVLAAGPAHAAVAPPVVVTAQPAALSASSTPADPSASAGAAASPSPSPGQRPSGVGSATASPVGPRDETGTGIVLPLLAATVVGLVALGLLFASAVTRRQREERRL